MVVDKPAGLPTEPPRGGGPSVASETGLRVCHRLDTDTTGVLVLARDEEGLRAVNAAFADRVAAKGYLAHVVGPLPETGRCTLPLGDWARGRVAIGRGRPAESRWTVRARHDGHALVEVEPLTGRTHQVRAHLSASGAPIWGDEAYGGPNAASLGLHAWWLVLPWPFRGARLEVLAPPPEGFVAGWGAELGALAPAASAWTQR